MFTLLPELAQLFPHLEVQQRRLGAETFCKLPQKRRRCRHITGLRLQYTEKGQTVEHVTTDAVDNCSKCPTARQ